MSTNPETTNKATWRRLQDALNSGDEDRRSKAIDEAFEPDVLIRTPLPVHSTGPQAIKEVFLTLHRAYPDLHVAVEDLIEEGDKVVGRHTVTGTHRGEYMGVQPTGKPVTYNEIFIARFADGRVGEIWGVVDVLAQMRQIGLLQPLEA
jgi:predicted ester cyclase